MAFPGFEQRDFDAYAPNKWSSNMYTLERRRVKEKLASLQADLQSVWSQQGLDVVGHLSDEFPSLWNNKKVADQWLFFSRDAAAEKELSDIIDTEKTLAATLQDPTPLYRHIFLGVRVNEQAVQAAVWLHHDAWVDRKNLVALIDDADRCDKLVSAFRALPEDCTFGLADREQEPVGALNPERFARFVRDFDTHKGWMFLGVTYGREDAVAAGPQLGARICQVMGDLAGAYRHIAWSKENDALSFDSIVQQQRRKREQAHERLEEERRQREQERAQRHQEDETRREQHLTELLEEQRWREEQRARRMAAAASRRAAAEAAFAALTGKGKGADPHREEEQAASPTQSRAPDRRAKEGAGSGRRHGRDTAARASRSGRAAAGRSQSTPQRAAVSPERMNDIQVGDRVVVLRGFLKDKEGVVTALDGADAVRVSFGMLSSRVSREDLRGLGPAK